MQAFARDFVDGLIPVVEFIGAVVIGIGVVVAFGAYVLSELRVRPRPYEAIRLLLGRFLALGLEFQLAADILGTAVSPTFKEIGKLGAIATIRTVLNFFLAKEIERAQRVITDERRNDAGPDVGIASGGSSDRRAPAPARDRIV